MKQADRFNNLDRLAGREAFHAAHDHFVAR